MEASPNWIRSDKLIVYSDLRVISKWAPSAPVWTPWPGSWSPCPQPQPQPRFQPLQQTAVAVHRQNSQGLSNSKMNSRQGPPEVPSNSKNNPQTPSRTEIENLLIIWKCGYKVIVNERYDAKIRCLLLRCIFRASLERFGCTCIRASICGFLPAEDGGFPRVADIFSKIMGAYLKRREHTHKTCVARGFPAHISGKMYRDPIKNLR